MTRSSLLALALLAAVAGCGGSGVDRPETAPAGAPTSPGTAALALGAQALQQHAPPSTLDIYLVGFHPLKDDPQHQIEAHHYCRQASEDLAQCALYDGNTAAANLTGIEYIISERLFVALPAAERPYWHPHNGEILSGQLVAPGLPDAAETELMRRKLNSYGKTWHTWDTSHGTALPLGEPALAWSFNRVGEAEPALIQRRDATLGISTKAERRLRQDLVPLAHPQAGVDALEGRFGRPTQAIPGVTDAGAGG